MDRMSRTRKGRIDRRRDPQLAREEALRPCPFLGYDRDQLGCYFAGRGALELAESQFRRAVWLNPFEASFRVHWALTLIKLERKPEAHDLLREVLVKNPTDKEAAELWRQNWPDEQLAMPGAEVGP
jgi:tetratricopeptide (TPR) repeat protein